MQMNEYQRWCRTLFTLQGNPKALNYLTMQLAAEAGEVAGNMAKAIRDDGGMFDGNRLVKLRKELGDVFWYLAVLSAELGLSLESVAIGNMEKLTDRHARGVLHGSGDDR